MDVEREIERSELQRVGTCRCCGEDAFYECTCKAVFCNECKDKHACIVVDSFPGEAIDMEEAKEILGAKSVEFMAEFRERYLRCLKDQERVDSLGVVVMNADFSKTFRGKMLLDSLDLEVLVRNLDEAFAGNSKRKLNIVERGMLDRLLCTSISRDGLTYHKQVSKYPVYRLIVAPAVKAIADAFEIFRTKKYDTSYVVPFFGVTVAKLSYIADLYQKKLLQMSSSSLSSPVVGASHVDACCCDNNVTVRLGSSLPEDLRTTNSMFWNKLYRCGKTHFEHGFIREDGTSMVTLIAKESHYLKDGELYAFYDGVLVKGHMCHNCEIGNRHPILTTLEESACHPLYIELEKNLDDDAVHAGQMIHQNKSFAQWELYASVDCDSVGLVRQIGDIFIGQPRYMVYADPRSMTQYFHNRGIIMIQCPQAKAKAENR